MKIAINKQNANGSYDELEGNFEHIPRIGETILMLDGLEYKVTDLTHNQLDAGTFTVNNITIELA